MRDFFDAANEALESGEKAVIAEITSQNGSTPRKTALMLVGKDGLVFGTIGGGISEALAIEDAKKFLAQGGEGGLHTYSLRPAEEGGLGAVCGGDVTVKFTPLTRQALTNYPPPPAEHVIVFGSGHVARETVPLLSRLGFTVSVFDDRSEYLTAAAFPEGTELLLGKYSEIANTLMPRDSRVKDACIVIVTRSHLCDLESAAWALQTHARYIGVIGSAKKHAFLRAELAKRGLEYTDSRVHAPIGLAIHSETPAEIAVSIAAEVVCVRNADRKQEFQTGSQWEPAPSAVPLFDAHSLLLASAGPVEETETVPLMRALGRVAARDVNAAVDNPPFARSPLDGCALGENTASGTYRVIGTAYAGTPFGGKCGPAEAVRVTTGAAVPVGTVFIAASEYAAERDGMVTVDAGSEKLAKPEPVGADFKRGDTLLSEGTVITPAHIGLLAASGFASVLVYRKLKIALLSTGDELVCAGTPLADGRIYNSGGPLLAARLAELSAAAYTVDASFGVKSDEIGVVKAEIERLARDFDVIITTGGVCKGEKDVLRDVLREIEAEILFWRVKIKPGSAIMAAKYAKKHILCLSGNPFSAFTGLELLGRPLLARLCRNESLLAARVSLPAASSFRTTKIVRPIGDVPQVVRCLANGGSVTFAGGGGSQLFPLAACNALAILDASVTEVHEGEMVEARLFN